MTSKRKIEANRANARASTGPKSARGRARSSQNALRHGLTRPVRSHPALAREVEELTLKIAGENANEQVQALAGEIAEIQVDLSRIRCARDQFLSRALAGSWYESHASQMRTIKSVGRLLGSRRPDLLVTKGSTTHTWSAPGSEKLAHIMTDEPRLFRAFDRYEQRALSRRKFLMRQMDAVRRSDERNGS